MSNVLTETDFVVKRRPQVFEVRTGYDICDPQGDSALASVEQVGRDNIEKLTRPQRADNAKTFLELRDASGPVLVLTHIQAAKSSLVVARPDGVELGRVRLEKLFGKSRFAIEAAGVGMGTVAARTWRNKNFAVCDGSGAEVAQVDMTRGSSGDASHDNQYAVHVDPAVADPLRALAVAVVIAVDMILWTR